MCIKRIVDGKTVEVELTNEELAAAYIEFVTNWMAGVCEELTKESYGVDVSLETAAILACSAYNIYAEGNGDTEYEACEKAVEEYILTLGKE